jgi:16S rRNA processing protein RimM
VTGGKRSSTGSSLVTDDSTLLLVGIVRKPHGLAGELSVEVTTSFPQRFAPGLSLIWQREGQQRSLTVRSARPHGKRMLLAFQGVPDLTTALSLAGGELSVPARKAFQPPKGFHYSHELAGWVCEDLQGRMLGRVWSLGEAPGGPLLEIETAEGRKVLVPFVETIVIAVEPEKSRIVLDPPEGLLDLN